MSRQRTVPRGLATLAILTILAGLAACDRQRPLVTAPQDPLPRGALGTAARATHQRPDYAVSLRAGYSAAVTASAVSDQFVGFYRYSTEEEQWTQMLGDSAFYRDAFVEGNTEHQGAADGDSWYAKAIGPDGTQVTWSIITFRASYNGQQDCFVTASWYLCGGDYAYVEWYMQAQCLPPGEYAMQFFKNGQMYVERTFTLKPSIPADQVTLYSQLGDTAQYSNYCTLSTNTADRHPCDGRTDEAKLTIHRLGCALTSAAMMLTYHGVNVDPRALNTWLRAHDGYSGASLIFPEVARYARQVAGVNVTWVGAFGGPDVAGLQQAICQYGPVPTNVYGSNGKRNGHWVLSWGRDNPLTTFRIYDPAGGAERLLTYARYRNTNNGRRVFAGPEKTYSDPYSGMDFFFHSPGELLVTDPQGRRTGYDPATATSYAEIPGAAYDSTAESDPDDPSDPGAVTREFMFMRAPAGTYAVTVTGTGTGTYMLDLRTWSTAGVPAKAAFADVPIAPGVRHTFRVVWDPTASTSQIPMTGGFKGGGQSATVDALLTYSSPTERQLDLPAGTTSYPLFVFYGQSIDPATFTAELNGASVASLFHPARGAMNAVALPLAQGRNVLLLNVRGGARLSRDADRLVFKVP
ncbi:MAG: C39 family peptidase [Lacisediminihabitans sp.]